MPTPLADMAPMDDHKIGPAGETFGQLKARVLDSRADLMTALLRGQADDALMERHSANVSLLEAAYVRVGLPYVAP